MSDLKKGTGAIICIPTYNERENIERIIEVISASGALAYTVARAQAASEAAIEALSKVPDNVYKASLVDLARFAVERRY